MSISIGILKKDDEVLNVWESNNLIQVAVKNKKGEVYIHSISPDENGIPRVDKDRLLIITVGNGEVKAKIPVTSDESSDDRNSVVHSTVEVTTF